MQEEINSDLISTQLSVTNYSVRPSFLVHKYKRPQKLHDKFSLDNLLKKFKCNFMNSLIQFLNDLIKANYGNQRMKLRKVNGNINTCSNKNYNKQLFQRKLKDLFTEEHISTKYYIVNEDQNKKNTQIIMKKKMFQVLLDFTYGEVIKKFYLENDNEDIYDSIYNLEESEIVRKRICVIRMKTFNEVVKENKNDKIKNDYNKKLSSFGIDIFNYLKLED